MTARTHVLHRGAVPTVGVQRSPRVGTALYLGQGMLCQVLGCHLNPCAGTFTSSGTPAICSALSLGLSVVASRSLVLSQVSPARSMASQPGQGTDRDGGFCWLLVPLWERKELPQGLSWQDGRSCKDAYRKGLFGMKAGSSICRYFRC